MPEHRLQAGKTLIDGLVTLGRELGYHVKPECAVRKGGKNPPAVDVAWMADDIQDFPLMIFEVETTAGNTIANNAIKVFGQPTEQFEKPLFFFHAVLHSGKDTTRIDALRGEYGRMNYRLYRLDHDETTKLVLDILSQHRRLKRAIDLMSLHELLKHDAWCGVDSERAMDQIEKLKYATGFLDAYARLSVKDSTYRRRFLDRLRAEEKVYPNCVSPSGYKTYLGDSWARPIHLAILARRIKKKSIQMFKRLRNWQERSHSSRMIGPNFGLSKDYNQFVIGIAPGLLAAVGAIFGRPDTARAYVANQIEVIVESLGRARPRFAFYAAAWLLHVAASLEDAQLFEAGRRFVNGRGGIPASCLLGPPFTVPSYDECDECAWDENLRLQRIQVPDMHAFSGLVRTSNPAVCSDEDAISLGIDLLIGQQLGERTPERIIALLNSKH